MTDNMAVFEASKGDAAPKSIAWTLPGGQRRELPNPVPQDALGDCVERPS